MFYNDRNQNQNHKNCNCGKNFEVFKCQQKKKNDINMAKWSDRIEFIQKKIVQTI